MAGVRLKRLKIDKFRGVAPGTELVFNDGFNVLLGKNGTGKTTLLRLIAVVLTGGFEHFKDEAFEIEYEMAFDGLRVVVTMRNTPRHPRQGSPRHATAARADMTKELSSSPDKAELPWYYKIVAHSAESPDEREHWTLVADALGAKSIWGSDQSTAKGISVLSPFEGDDVVGAALNLFFDALLEQAKGAPESPPAVTNARVMSAYVATLDRSRLRENCARFDEAVGTFNAVVGSGDTDDKAGGIPWVYLLVTVKEGRLELTFSRLVPAQVLHTISGMVLPETFTAGVPLSSDRIPFLARYVELTGTQTATLRLNLESRTVDDDGDDVAEFGNFSFMIRVDESTTITHELLSYGQKRLLSFLYYADCNPDIVIADELVNGLHHEWIQSCLQEIQDRQSFLTSQNPILLDMLPFDSVEDAQRTFILCAHEVRDGRGRMVWRNMSAEQAATFYRAYETQALHVSEILRVNDLW